MLSSISALPELVVFHNYQVMLNVCLKKKKILDANVQNDDRSQITELYVYIKTQRASKTS